MIAITDNAQFLSGLVLFARIHSKLTRNQVAASLGVNYQYVWDIENCHRVVTAENLEYIIPALKLDMVSFWGLVPAYIIHLQTEALIPSLNNSTN